MEPETGETEVMAIWDLSCPMLFTELPTPPFLGGNNIDKNQNNYNNLLVDDEVVFAGRQSWEGEGDGGVRDGLDRGLIASLCQQSHFQQLFLICCSLRPSFGRVNKYI